jgi:hypothetical protein
MFLYFSINFSLLQEKLMKSTVISADLPSPDSCIVEDISYLESPNLTLYRNAEAMGYRPKGARMAASSS